MEQRTLLELRTQSLYLSDNDGATLRHPPADVNTQINSAIRAYRARVTANGLPYFIETTSPATLAGTLVSGETYSEVPWPAGPPRAVQLLGVDVASSTTADDWYDLRPITWASRRSVAYGPGGQPRFFAIRRLPQADPADLDAVLAGVIALFPGQTQGAYRISYLPDHVDLAADGDLFLALPEGVQWVVQTVVMALSERDDDVHETFAIARARRDEADAQIIAAASRVQSAGPILPRRRGPYAGYGRRFR